MRTNTTKKFSKRPLGQAGIASILVSMIMIVVITLIVLGFSEVTRSNQREALDQTLSTQAYYAAESGVNDASGFIKKHLTDGALPTYSPICDDFITNANSVTVGSLVPTLANGTSYTCLTVNATPSDLFKQKLSLSDTLVWPVINATGTNFSSMTIKWAQNAAYSDDSTGCGSITGFPYYGTGLNSYKCNIGVLRIDVAQVNDAVAAAGSDANAHAAALDAATKTFFVKPGSGGTINFPTANKSNVTNADCDTTSCTEKFTLAGANKYYVRMTMLYQPTDSIDLTATAGVGGSAVKFSGAQAIVDSTGKAQDELRRIQVRVPLTSASVLPQYSLQGTGSICKQQSIDVPDTTVTYGCNP